MEKNKQIPQPIRGEKGAETKIPHNVERDRQNPDMLVPPETDHGTVPNMKFSFSDVHNRLEKGGYAREVTVRELPISDKLAPSGSCTGIRKPNGRICCTEKHGLRLLTKTAETLLKM